MVRQTRKNASDDKPSQEGFVVIYGGTGHGVESAGRAGNALVSGGHKCAHRQAVVIYRTLFISATLAVICLNLAIGVAAAQPPKPGSKGKQEKSSQPPPVEQITANTYRVGKALVDTKERTVTCPGEINMDEGAIEYLAVAPGGKTHESLLRIGVRPLHLQLALLMLDLEPKNVLTQQGDRNTPQGDPVELRIRWRDREGQEHTVRAEEMVTDGATNKPMPQHNWVFTGSRILKQGFQADLEKSLVAVWHDPAAILDNPLPGGGNNAYLVNPNRAPKRGTRIDLILRAAAPPKATGSAAHEPRATSHGSRPTTHEPRATDHDPPDTTYEPRATSYGVRGQR